MKVIMEVIKDVVNCSNNQFFIFDKEMITFEDKKHNQISSLTVDSQQIEIFCLNETELQDPSFKTIKDAQNKIYTKKYQSHPIVNSNGKLIACFQVESKYRIIQKQSGPEMGNILQSIKKHVGFSLIDEQVIKLIATVINIKLDQLMALKNKKNM